MIAKRHISTTSYQSLASGETFIRHDGGDGKVILLVHGGPGMEHSYLVDGFSQFSDAGYNLYYYDQAGTGQDRYPASEVSLDRLRRQLCEVIDFVTEQAGASPILIGHSFGAYLIVDAAPWTVGLSKEPPILVTPMAPTWKRLEKTNERFLKRFSPQEVQTIEELEQEGTSEAGARVIELLVPKWISPQASGSVRFSEYNPALNASIFEEMKDYDVRPNLEAIGKGTTIILGSDDFILPEDFVELDGLSTFITIQSSGHFPFAEQPASFCDALVSRL